MPRTPSELAHAAVESVAAGASMVHVHPRDQSGLETLEARYVVDVVMAIRTAAPGLRVSVSTRDGIVDGPATKFAHVSQWPSPQLGGPDSATVNWHEEGAAEIAIALQDRGAAVEAGGWSRPVERILGEVPAPLLVHGEEEWTWPVLRWAQAAGHDERIGLEDTCDLPTGEPARDNAELVATAARSQRSPAG